MKKITILPAILVTLFLYSCDSSSPLFPPVINDTKPVWSQVGFDARNSFNRNAPGLNFPAIQNGQLNWMYFPDTNATGFGDGSESLVDSKGNFYHLVTRQPTGNIIKLNPEGELIWSRDTLSVDGYFGIAISSDEKKLYYSHMYGMTARDSGGNFLWHIGNNVHGIPAVNSEGNIFALLNNKPTLVSESGTIIWQIGGLDGLTFWPAMDKEDNIYGRFIDQSNNQIICKIDKSGNMQWSYLMSQAQYPPISSAIIDANSNIYFNHNGTLYSLTQNGQFRWSRELNAGAIPCITNDNRLVCITGNGVEIIDTNNTSLSQMSLSYPSFYVEPYLRIDSENNIYYNSVPTSIYYKVTSIDINSLTFRWEFQSTETGFVLPGLVLSPNATLLSTPKRPKVLMNIQ